MARVADEIPGFPRLRDSEMGRRVTAFDWSRTVLGPIESWPRSLKVAVGICLNSRFPTFVWWGNELVNIHNDAYVPVLGRRHPEALGMPARRIWSDIWPAIGDDVEAVLRGEAIYKERERLVMVRNGFEEETWFTYSHSPIPDDDGRVGGLFQVCIDETRSVLAERERARADDRRRCADERARSILESIDESFIALDREWRITYVNPQSERVTGLSAGAMLGRDLREVFPEVRGSEFETLHARAMQDRVAGSVVAFYSPHDRWYETHSYPSPEGVSIYFRDVTDRERANESRRRLTEAHAAQSRQLYQLLSSITDFAYAFDLEGRFTFVNKPLLDLWGIDLAQAVGKDFHELGYPTELAARLQDQIQRVVRTREPVVDETPYTSPSGATGYYQYIFTPVLSADGELEAVAGSTRDFSHRKKMEADLEQSVRELEAQRANLAAIIEHAPAFVCVLEGPDHVVAMANERYYELVGRRDIVGGPLAEMLPEVAEQGFVALLDRVYATGEPYVGDEVTVMLRNDPNGPPERRIVNFVYQAIHDRFGRVSGVFVHGVEVTSLVVAREKARVSEERYRVLFTSLEDGFCIVEITFDAEERAVDCRFLEVNPAFAGQTGIADAAGRSAVEMELGLEPHWFETLGRVARTGESIRFVNEARNLGARWFDVYAFRIGGDDSRLVAMLFKDVTLLRRKDEEREKLHASERAARSDAERAGRMKDEFLATLSHELRTPLSAVLGWASILKKGDVTAETLAQGLAVIERNARMQTQLVTDLLDMSRIISGKMRLEIEPIDLPLVVEAALDVVRPAADLKEIAIASKVEDVHDTLYGDPARLQQIVWNLVSNSVKFTPRGGRVEVRVARVRSHVEISVRDSGQGIGTEFLPYVFERFRQADSSSTRSHGGLGLGLAIVKQLVESHGGIVRVESEGADRGSTFTVELPLVSRRPTASPLRARNKTAAASSDAAPDLDGVRALVVDDDPDAREFARRLLESCGAEVLLAASADEATAFVESERLDVILSDIGLPLVDGYELMLALRRRGHLVPAAAVTAFARADDRDRALRSGYQAHLAKPVEPNDLLATVAELLRRTK